VFLLAMTIPSARAAYDEQLSKTFLVYSAAAYSNNPQRCFANTTFTVTKTFNNTFLGFGTFAYTAVDPKTKAIVIAFRGTAKITQLIQEALTSVVPVPCWFDTSLSLNAFFYSCEGLLYDSMKVEVQRLLANYQGYNLYVTGHSLGAAVASITIMHLVYDGVVNSSRPIIYTFGEPRVGDYKFAQKFNALFPTANRVVHYKDIVAHLPPCHASFNSKLQYVCDGTVDPKAPYLWAYQHATEIWYQEPMPDLMNQSQGSFKICQGTPYGEDYACSDGLPLKDSIDDHTHYYTLNGKPFDVALSCSGFDVFDF